MSGAQEGLPMASLKRDESWKVSQRSPPTGSSELLFSKQLLLAMGPTGPSGPS